MLETIAKGDNTTLSIGAATAAPVLTALGLAPGQQARGVSGYNNTQTLRIQASDYPDPRGNQGDLKVDYSTVRLFLNPGTGPPREVTRSSGFLRGATSAVTVFDDGDGDVEFDPALGAALAGFLAALGLAQFVPFDWLALPLVLGVPVIWVASRWDLKRARAGYIREHASYSRINTTLAETVEGARTVEALALGTQRSERIDADIAESYAAESSTRNLRSVFFPAVEIGYLVPVVATLLVGGWLMAQGSISLAQMLPGAEMLLVTTPQEAAERVAVLAGLAAVLLLYLEPGSIAAGLALALPEPANANKDRVEVLTRDETLRSFTIDAASTNASCTAFPSSSPVPTPSRRPFTSQSNASLCVAATVERPASPGQMSFRPPVNPAK